MNYIIKFFFRLPLIFHHILGLILGLGMYLLDIKFKERITKNIARTKIVNDKSKIRSLAIKTAMHIGMGLTESFTIWSAQQSNINHFIQKTINWNLIEKAQQQKKGIIFLTPHIGSFEITAQYYGIQNPITILFKPSKNNWINNFILEGRTKNKVKPANIYVGGLREIMRALKKGEAVGILPDQVPPQGQGVWSDFFHDKVYTMNLVEKLHKLTGAPVIMAFGKRLTIGTGFQIELFAVEGKISADTINKKIEELVLMAPEQYLWNYRRYKLPKK